MAVSRANSWRLFPRDDYQAGATCVSTLRPLVSAATGDKKKMAAQQQHAFYELYRGSRYDEKPEETVGS